jgi:hypothetical protein
MCLQQDRGRKTRQLDSLTPSLSDLCERGRITWAAQENRWTGQPEEVARALTMDGFHECQREMPTGSRGRRRPQEGTWEGVNPQTKSVACMVWRLRPAAQPPTMVIEIDGDTITNPTGARGEEICR